MLDKYGEITPDFEAWEKLGYYLEEIHSHTYTFCKIDKEDMYDFIRIVAEYDNKLNEPEYTKEHFTAFSSKLEEFTQNELNQIGLDIENFKKERTNK